MKKSLVICIMIVLSLINFSGCSETSKLSDEQQALMDTFFENKELWEEYEDLYCTGLHMYESQKGVFIHCSYSTDMLGHTNEAVSSHTVLKTISYFITEDEVEFSGEISNSVSLPGVMLNNANADAPKLIGTISYYFGDDDDAKKGSLETLFIKTE